MPKLPERHTHHILEHQVATSMIVTVITIAKICLVLLVHGFPDLSSTQPDVQLQSR